MSDNTIEPDKANRLNPDQEQELSDVAEQQKLRRLGIPEGLSDLGIYSFLTEQSKTKLNINKQKNL